MPRPRKPGSQKPLPAARLETGLFATCLNQALGPSGAWNLQITRAQNRHYRRAAREFDKLKALRPDLPKLPKQSHFRRQP